MLILPLALFSMLFVGCEKENNNGNLSANIPARVSVNVGKTYDLGVSGTWSSSKPFLATVTSSGVVKGNHVGSCELYYSNQGNTSSCQVEVQANINLFPDPITQWGMSKSSVISRVGNDYQTTSDGNIAYETDNTVAPYVGYQFTNGVLSSTLLVIKKAYKDQAFDHLSERYEYIYEENNQYMFVDANTIGEATTTVLLKSYNNSYWEIFYSKK